MRRSVWSVWKFLGVTVLVLFILLFIVLPNVVSTTIQNSEILSEEKIAYYQWVEAILRNSMIAFAAIWIFSVGASFASFLNVVAWRVPRGKSILGSSHCPYCAIKLTFRDNIPVIGWIKNGGKCTNCRLPISPRYLIVEVILGTIFLVATMVLLLSAGGVLPFVPRPVSTPVNRLLLEPGGHLVAILGLHLTGIMAIFTFALVEQEGKRIPTSIYFVSVVLATAIVFTWPQAAIVQWNYPLENSEWPMSRAQALASLGIGVAFGSIVGLIVGMFTNSRQLAFGLSIVGLVCGWQSTLIVAMIWLVLALFFRTPTRGENAMTLIKVLSLPHSVLLIVWLIFLSSWRTMEFL